MASNNRTEDTDGVVELIAAPLGVCIALVAGGVLWLALCLMGEVLG